MFRIALTLEHKQAILGRAEHLPQPLKLFAKDEPPQRPTRPAQTSVVCQRHARQRDFE